MLSKAEIRRLRALQLKKHRVESGCFLVEGRKAVAELLASELAVESIYATASWLEEHREAGRRATLAEVAPAELARISSLPSPQQVLAVARLPDRALAPGALADGWSIALDDVQDPGNVGAILRVADWYGFKRVLCSRGAVDPFHPKVIAASAGSFCRVGLHEVALAETLRDAPATVLGCDLDGADVRALAPITGGAVLVIGSEGQGLSAGVRREIDRFVTIPRLGKAESLNAAIAAGIICDNLVRLRGA